MKHIVATLIILAVMIAGVMAEIKIEESYVKTTTETAAESVLSTEGKITPTTTEKPTETTTEAEGGDEINLTKDPSQLEDVVLEDLAKEYVSHMTLEEKVGQMFLVNIEQLEPAAGKTYQYKNMTDTMKKNMQRYPVGGVILFARNIKTRSQTMEFIKNMQELSATPMYIGVDEEGGTISRIASNPKMKTTQFPNMSVIGVENDEEIGDLYIRIED